MKCLLFIFVLGMSSPFAHGAIVSTIKFNAEVTSFDKKLVVIKTNGKVFRVPRTSWEATNGPVRTGAQPVALSFTEFAKM